MTIVDATFASNQCGSFVSIPRDPTPSHQTLQTLFSWRAHINFYSVGGGASSSGSVFSRGYFVPRVNGWYHVCAFSRFRNTGNSNDVTVLVVSLSTTKSFVLLINAYFYDCW